VRRGAFQTLQVANELTSSYNLLVGYISYAKTTTQYLLIKNFKAFLL